MNDYLKALNDITIPNPKGEKFPPMVVWKKGEYYKIIRESETIIFPYNELLKNINGENKVVDYVELFNLMIGVEKPNSSRVPLGFIRLSPEIVFKETQK